MNRRLPQKLPDRLDRLQYRSCVELNRLISEYAAAPPLDGRITLPQEWTTLARARLGDEDATEVVERLSGHLDPGTDAAVKLAAKRMKAPTRWPQGVQGLQHLVNGGESPLGQWRTICLGQAEDIAGRAALVDTTTLASAMGLISGGDVPATPMTVLDLATLLNTLCVYDTVCYLENPTVSLRELETVFGPDLFIELPVESTAEPGADYAALGDIRNSLRALYKGRTVPWLNDLRKGRLGTAEQQKALVRAWETILARPCDPAWLLRDPDEGKSADYPDISWRSPTDLLLSDIASADSYALAREEELLMAQSRSGRRHSSNKKERSVLAQTSNARALFNTNLAEVLGVRYAANLPRIPILRYLSDATRGEITQLLRIPAAAAELADVFGNQIGPATREQPEFLEVPFFASYILQKSCTPMEIPEVLRSAREKTEVFRSRLTELNEQVKAGNGKARADLQAALKAEHGHQAWTARGFLQTVSSVLTLTVLLTDPGSHVLSAVAASLSGIVTADTIRPILGRARMQYELLGGLKPTVNSASAVDKLWGVADLESWAARTQSLASVT